MPGRGATPGRGRQDQSHPHCAVALPANKRLAVADLGCNAVFLYAFDAGGEGSEVLSARPVRCQWLYWAIVLYAAPQTSARTRIDCNMLQGRPGALIDCLLHATSPGHCQRSNSLLLNMPRAQAHLRVRVVSGSGPSPHRVPRQPARCTIPYAYQYIYTRRLIRPKAQCVIFYASLVSSDGGGLPRTRTRNTRDSTLCIHFCQSQKSPAPPSPHSSS